jgi:hypothetical protein
LDFANKNDHTVIPRVHISVSSRVSPMNASLNFLKHKPSVEFIYLLRDSKGPGWGTLRKPGEVERRRVVRVVV